MDGSFAFDQFVLDTHDRRLKAADGPVELNGRYFDALTLLIREQGKLVSKDRFLAEVWRGVPVTDEALTQCIKTLRRQLGDDAAQPRFIETVPKHGYRFIAPVRSVDQEPARQRRPAADPWHEFLAMGAAGTLGGAVAGAVGGLVYGFAAASHSAVGAISVLLVFLCMTMLVGTIGGAGVSFALATTCFSARRSRLWFVVAGAGGGLIVGALGKLLGHDIFTLIVGNAPSDITGAMEGALLGAAIGLAAWFTATGASAQRAVALAAIFGALAGLLIIWLGGHLMLGSLALLTSGFPSSKLQVNEIGRLFGENGIGPLTESVTAAIEGALFSGGLVLGLALQRKLGRQPSSVDQ